VKRAFPVAEVVHALAFEGFHGRELFVGSEDADPAGATGAGAAVDWDGSIAGRAARVGFVVGFWSRAAAVVMC
jgi:hypothetical protein